MKSQVPDHPHYSWPVITGSLGAAVTEQLFRSISDRDASGIIGEYEAGLASLYNTRHCVSFSSGTAAMHCLAIACDIGEGDEVIGPDYTFFATLSPFVFAKARVRLADCDSYGNVTADTIAEQISSDTKAVVVTHMWGIPCDMDPIIELCRKHGLFLFEDCSHAHAATYKGRRVGTLGDAAIFSTNQKFLTTGEGGFLITNNTEIYEGALLAGHYNHRCFQELRSDCRWSEWSLTGFGLKYRLHPLAASLGLHQVRRFAEIEKRRRRNLETLLSACGSVPCFSVAAPPYEWSHGLYVLAFRISESFRNQRSSIVQNLRAYGGVEFDIPGSTRPLRELAMFRTAASLEERKVWNSDVVYNSTVKLPLWGYEGDEVFVDFYAKALSNASAA
jgi:perosamine synthetase